MTKATTESVSMFCIDIENYSSMSDADKVDAQSLLDRLIVEACEDADVNVRDRAWLDGGDGGYLLLAGRNDAALSVLEAFAPKLEKYNSRSLKTKQIYVRYALHSGVVRSTAGKLGAKHTSDDIVAASRMLEGMDRGLTGQVVCSGTYKESLIRFGDYSVIPFTALPPIVDKHGNEHEVWNLYKPNEYGIFLEDSSANP